MALYSLNFASYDYNGCDRRQTSSFVLHQRHQLFMTNLHMLDLPLGYDVTKVHPKSTLFSGQLGVSRFSCHVPANGNAVTLVLRGTNTVRYFSRWRLLRRHAPRDDGQVQCRAAGRHFERIATLRSQKQALLCGDRPNRYCVRDIAHLVTI